MLEGVEEEMVVRSERSERELRRKMHSTFHFLRVGFRCSLRVCFP